MVKKIRVLRRPLVVLALAFNLLLFGNGAGVDSPVDVAAFPHKFGLVHWEVVHLPQKWWHKLIEMVSWNSEDLEERRQKLIKFFHTGAETLGDIDKGEGQAVTNVFAEESLEQEISSILKQEGLASQIGIVFPPVDLVFSKPPKLLVISPRNKIEVIKTILLDPNIGLEEMEKLEEELLIEQDLAALVEDIGGVATYPSIVPADAGLLRAAELGAHEWLHQFWFFHPLGRNFNSSSTMRTLNETAADLAGTELGQAVYKSIAGGVLPVSENYRYASVEINDPGAFDFRAEMNKTRVLVDKLLETGQTEEAELYMEERRQRFVDNGILIRKLNQAYFAFHGAYASSPASVSPIKGQLEQVRASVGSVGGFIRVVAGFDSVEKLERYLSNTGRVSQPVLDK